MKFKLLILLLFALISTKSISAEPSLLWNKQFEEPIVMTSELLNFETIGDKKPGFPLKTIMNTRNIIILDEVGKTSKTISLADYQKAVISGNGEMIAAMKDRKILIFNINNELQGTINIIDTHPVVLPEHILLKLSPDGEVLVLISNLSNSMFFYTKKGKEINKYYFDDLRGVKAIFSGNSRYVAVHVPNWGEGKTNGFLILLNKNGEQQWVVDHKGCSAKIDISYMGNKIVLATAEKLYSLDIKGQIIFEKELIPGNNNLALSGNGNYIALTRTSEHSIYFLDSTTGQLLWNNKIKGFDPINSPITSLAVSDDGKYTTVCISKDWLKTNRESQMNLFDKKGNIILQIPFEQKKITSVLDPHGSCMLVTAEKELNLYRCE